MSTLEIVFRGNVLDVDFDYDPPERGSRDMPSSTESVFINAVRVGGTDITELTYEITDQIAFAVLVRIHMDRADEAMQAAIERYRDRIAA